MSRDINISLIDADPRQPRQTFDEVALQELAASIEENGLIQPVLVRPVDMRFILVHGERRLRAAQLLGWTMIPAEVRDITADDARWITLVENLQREDLTPLEEANAYQAFVESGITQTALAMRLGKSQSHVATMLRLLTLPGAVRAELQARRLTVGHAKQLLRLKDHSVQEMLSQQAISGDWSVARLKREADDRQEPDARLLRDAAALVFWSWEQRGRKRTHAEYPEERLPDMYKGPIAEQLLPIDSIVIPDSILKGREARKTSMISWYAAIFPVLPSLAVCRVGDHDLLADGWFRLRAAQSLGHETIECRIYAGDRESDAFLYWCAANAVGGLSLTLQELAAVARKHL